MTLGHNDLVLCAGTVINTPFLERLAPVARAGFSGLSMWANDFTALEAEGIGASEIRTRVADAGLDISEFETIACWLPDQRPSPENPDWGGEMLLKHTPDYICSMAAAVGARSVTVIEAFGVPFDADAMAESFANVCDRAAEDGLQVDLEFMPTGGISTLSQAWEIVRGADRSNGGVLLDSWHFSRGHSTLAELAGIPGEKISCVQFGDAPATPGNDLSEEMIHRRLLPGDGELDLAGLWQTLEEIGCTAPVEVEVFSDALAAEPVETAALRCSQAIRDLLRGEDSHV